MKYFVFSLVVLVAVIHSAFSILCYHCDKNVQNCTVRNCTNSSDTCSYYSNKYGGAIEQKCNTNTTCQGIANSCGPNTLCLMKCCHSDHCNKDGPNMAPVTTATKTPAVITSPTSPNTAFQPTTSKKILAVTMVIILISVL